MLPTILAAISGEQWGLAKIGLPEPFAKIATVLLVLLVCVILINALLTLVGKPFITW